MVKKRTTWKKSHKMFKTDIYSQCSQTEMSVLASKHSTWAHTIHLYIISTSRRVRWIRGSITKKAQNVFVGVFVV